MKYILFQTDAGMKVPVIFPETLTHSVVSVYVAAAIKLCTKSQAVPISAGFVGIGVDVSVHGESESLNLKHNPLDAMRIMAGSSIAFMPDDMVEGILKKLEERKDDTDVAG